MLLKRWGLLLGGLLNGSELIAQPLSLALESSGLSLLTLCVPLLPNGPVRAGLGWPAASDCAVGGSPASLSVSASALGVLSQREICGLGKHSGRGWLSWSYSCGIHSCSPQRPRRAPIRHSLDRNQLCQFGQRCYHCMARGSWDHAHQRALRHHCYSGLLPLRVALPSVPHLHQSFSPVWTRALGGAPGSPATRLRL